MPKGASGKGISEAVRQAVPQWMDDETITMIQAEARKKGITVSRYTLDEPRNWARQKRYSYSRGFIRPYVNNQVPSELNLILEARSNQKDDQVEYFTIKVGSKFITGGDCKIASVFSSSNEPNVARVGATKKVAEVSPTTKRSFRRLTQEEINKINVQIEYGDGFDQLFDERS